MDAMRMRAPESGVDGSGLAAKAPEGCDSVGPAPAALGIGRDRKAR
jgi:hypothetical protein